MKPLAPVMKMFGIPICVEKWFRQKRSTKLDIFRGVETIKPAKIKPAKWNRRWRTSKKITPTAAKN
jgi:hypothetical protein